MLGKDILRRKGFGPPSGDREFVGDTDNIDSPYIGTSKFVDVANGPDGTYTVLDSTRSRLFTYDSEGYLLYAFGGPDVTAGGFRTPASLAQLDDCLYVLDSNTRAITMFRRTGFGDTVAEAIAWQEGGDYKKSAELWSEALTPVSYTHLDVYKRQDAGCQEPAAGRGHGDHRSPQRAPAQGGCQLLSNGGVHVPDVRGVLCGGLQLPVRHRRSHRHPADGVVHHRPGSGHHPQRSDPLHLHPEQQADRRQNGGGQPANRAGGRHSDVYKRQVCGRP